MVPSVCSCLPSVSAALRRLFFPDHREGSTSLRSADAPPAVRVLQNRSEKAYPAQYFERTCKIETLFSGRCGRNCYCTLGLKPKRLSRRGHDTIERHGRVCAQSVSLVFMYRFFKSPIGIRPQQRPAPKITEDYCKSSLGRYIVRKCWHHCSNLLQIFETSTSFYLFALSVYGSRLKPLFLFN